MFRDDPRVAARMPQLEDSVRRGTVSPFVAARELLTLFRSHRNS
jgi:hypothetical protein